MGGGGNEGLGPDGNRKGKVTRDGVVSARKESNRDGGQDKQELKGMQKGVWGKKCKNEQRCWQRCGEGEGKHESAGGAMREKGEEWARTIQRKENDAGREGKEDWRGSGKGRNGKREGE